MKTLLLAWWILVPNVDSFVVADGPVPQPPLELPAEWDCQEVGAIFTPDPNDCQPAAIVVYCYEPDRTFVERLKWHRIDGIRTCLPVRRQEAVR